MWASAQRDGPLPNIGGALCSVPQFLADAHYLTAMHDENIYGLRYYIGQP